MTYNDNAPIQKSFEHSPIPPFAHSTIRPFDHSTIRPFHHSNIRPFHHSPIRKPVGRVLRTRRNAWQNVYENRPHTYCEIKSFSDCARKTHRTKSSSPLISLMRRLEKIFRKIENLPIFRLAYLFHETNRTEMKGCPYPSEIFLIFCLTLCFLNSKIPP